MNTSSHFDQLITHLFSCQSEETLSVALQELLTPSEVTEISKRLQIFRLLADGVPQREIAKQLGVGIATVTRGSRALKAKEGNE